MNKIAFVFLLSAYTLIADAQWRIGITGGATYNQYTIDNHYMSDWHYSGAWGKVTISNNNIYVSTFGLMGQYDFCDWFGVRVDLNWTMKNHRQYRTMVSTDYETLNSYLQLPVMASFSFGSQKIKGFLNTGFYSGYWLSSHDYGNQQFLMSNTTMSGTFKNEFVEERDQRFDYGLVGGLGIEWCFKFMKKNWAWQIFEARIYYSTQSIQKDYMKFKDPRYNTTLALQSGLCYFF